MNKLSIIGILLSSLICVSSASAAVIEISSGTAVSFQDEGTLTADQTSVLNTLDGNFGPIPTGTVTQSYYATGTSAAYFDAISLNFDLSSVGFANVGSAELWFYVQKGDYATIDGSDAFNAGRNAWEHYQVLEGSMNSSNQDATPFVSGTTDFFGGGTKAANEVLGWVSASIDNSWITSDSFDVTLRLWNARIDKVELRVNDVSAPSAGILVLFGALCAFATRRSVK
jgi:hypothetical protein